MDKQEIENIFKYLGLNKDFQCEHNVKSNHPALQLIESYRLSTTGQQLNKICEITVYETISQPSLVGEFYLSFEESKLLLDFEVKDIELDNYLEIIIRYNKILENLFTKSSMSHPKIFFNIEFDKTDNELIYKNKEFEYCIRIDHPTIKSKNIGIDVERLINFRLNKLGIHYSHEYNIDDLLKVINMAII